MSRPKGLPKTGGRQKGTTNKTTQALKEMILEAANLAGGGGPDGTVRYLEQQAKANPASFMGLLGRVLPMTVAGKLNHEHEFAGARDKLDSLITRQAAAEGMGEGPATTH
jgi:hypothetical protein